MAFEMLEQPTRLCKGAELRPYDLAVVVTAGEGYRSWEGVLVQCYCGGTYLIALEPSLGGISLYSVSTHLARDWMVRRFVRGERITFEVTE